MTVIVMAQEIGSRGDEIAAAIAERLDVELVCRKSLTRRTAESMCIDEAAVQRLMDGKASLLERWTTDRHRLCHSMAEQIVKLAARGNVLIQDCGAAPLLRPIRHVICVYFWTPAGSRRGSLATRAARFGEARKEMMTTRSWWRSFGNDGSNTEPYDLVINTERVSVSQCVEQVVRLAQNPQFQATTASRDMLANLVRNTDGASQSIACTPNGWAPPVLEVEVGAQTIRLAGVTCSEQAIARVEHHLHGRKAMTEASVHSLPPTGGLG